MTELIQALNQLTWPGVVGLCAIVAGAVAIVYVYFRHL